MEEKTYSIELLYFDECPSWKETRRLLKDILHELDLDVEINILAIESHEKAILHQFPGSPTIKVNGVDIFPTMDKNFGLGCRVYQTQHGLRGSPTREMIFHKLKEIMGTNYPEK